MSQISILGCGWLGLPLAKKLLADGYSVNGSTTSPEKLQMLSESGIRAFIIELEATPLQTIIDFLAKSEILIIAIPPKTKQEIGMPYAEKIRVLIPQITAAGIRKVIFISSTSVYADDNSVVTESTIPRPATPGGNQILEAESLLVQNPQFKTAIIRFGGLLGSARHPIYHLAGRTELENPDAPVNLIHQNDCIGIILSVIKKDAWQIINGVHPSHPTRKEYYTARADALGLTPPKFAANVPSVGKTVVSTKVGPVLRYNFTTAI